MTRYEILGVRGNTLGLVDALDEIQALRLFRTYYPMFANERVTARAIGAGFV